MLFSEGSGVSPFFPTGAFFNQPLGAMIFFVTLVAECNRIPFDLPEAEAELVAGYHTEYGGIKLILFYIGEYAHVMAASALMVIFYFGGYSLYPLTAQSLTAYFDSSFLASLILFFVFIVKFFFFLFVFIWIRWSMPRFRYDQLMNLGWRSLLPLALFTHGFNGCFYFFGPLLGGSFGYPGFFICFPPCCFSRLLKQSPIPIRPTARFIWPPA